MIMLLTNDDGIDAPGLDALERAVRARGGSVVVVAPREPHSGCGHRVTTDRPLAIERVASGRFHVDGTPADCVRLALAGAVPGVELSAVDWVLSGINAGGNLGVDVHHSGTVAAAREAASHGVRSLAASHYHRRERPIDWERAARWMADLLAELLPRPLETGAFWNVNLPHDPVDASPAAMPAVVECGIDPSPLPLGYSGEPAGWRYHSRYHERPRLPGGDVDTCFGGRISLSLGRVV